MDVGIWISAETNGHAWLQHRCWNAWQMDQKAETAFALTAMGIEKRIIKP